MRYLLDTNILIAVALGSEPAARRRLADLDEGGAVTSAVAYAEVLYGSRRGRPPALAYLATLIEEVAVLPFDQSAAAVYADLAFKRASYDRLIAAHALALGLTVATGNVADFADVPGLKVENWLLPQ